MVQQSIEDYLKAIYLLALSESPVRTTTLANEREVKPASVTNMVQKLAGQGLVQYRKHQGVTLTPNGEKIALRVLRYHGLLELFLMQELDYGWDEVHQEAEQLEHVISKQFAERLNELLGSPEFDPHGEPIPQADGSLTVVEAVPLIDLSHGTEATITRINDDTDGELLIYLEELGLLPGVTIKVCATAPFEGPITVSIDGAEKVVGYRAAGEIMTNSVEEAI